MILPILDTARIIPVIAGPFQVVKPGARIVITTHCQNSVQE